ncbi:hypothetical protein V1L54_00895 [Streptomyces sp. TRM 70361]|uniref:hypothetical protein n=1 Tax=Streptomyces sp. TRM 70361 TaxID=3116553 RepID=UPI002E7B5DF9|nr:hypothetical protein [Streptomyces sp. TRM 70361]MEE1937987.1 hypothetical protein [Streptomyces sp. TRM 70361]
MSGRLLLEHGCRVRDLCAAFRRKLPTAPGRGERGGVDGARGAWPVPYRHEEPRRVALEVVDAAESLAAEFDRLSDADWERECSGGAAPRLTVEVAARHLVHDAVHDLPAGRPLPGGAAGRRGDGGRL